VSVLSTLDHLEFVAPLAGGSTFCEAVATSGCTSAHASPSSEVFGVPITLYGLSFYLAVLGLAGWACLRGQAARPGAPGAAHRVPVALAILSGMAVVYSMYLAAELYRRGAFCPFCLALYGVNGGLFGVAIAWARPAWRHGWAAIRSSGRMLGVAAVGGGLVLLGTTAAYFLARAAREVSTRPVATVLPSGRLELPARIPSRGRAGASPELVVFADFECPACARLHAAVSQVVRKMGTDAPRVRFVNYPLDSGCNPYASRRTHPSACMAARGAICAEREGVFWEYAEIRFASPGRHEREDLVASARALGLDAEAFEACLEAPQTGRALAEDIELARAAGVTATPTYLLDGQKYVGATSAVALEGMIRASTR
jgi:protein-disulfide isomerase/uncharacterized membrane protein